MQEQHEYWDKRFETYEDLDIIKSKRMAYNVINIIKRFSLNSPVVWDVGCGTGVITRVIRENLRHSRVYGIDLSEKMTRLARKRALRGLWFFQSDWMNWRVDYQDFMSPDIILMSLFLHHLVEKRDRLAVDRAFKGLKNNGWIVVAEAIPPVDEIFDEYETMFSMKEERNCYTLTKLVSMLRSSGFVNVRSTSYRFMLKLLTWLNDETISEERKDLIYDFHVNSSEKFKKAYNMTPIHEGDYLLNCRMAIVMGQKKSSFESGIIG